MYVSYQRVHWFLLQVWLRCIFIHAKSRIAAAIRDFVWIKIVNILFIWSQKISRFYS